MAQITQLSTIAVPGRRYGLVVRGIQSLTLVSSAESILIGQAFAVNSLILTSTASVLTVVNIRIAPVIPFSEIINILTDFDLPINQTTNFDLIANRETNFDLIVNPSTVYDITVALVVVTIGLHIQRQIDLDAIVNRSTVLTLDISRTNVFDLGVNRSTAPILNINQSIIFDVDIQRVLAFEAEIR